MKKPRKRSASTLLLGFAGRSIPDQKVLKQRFADRDQRQATDTRTELEKFLGDPPADRSALTQRAPVPRWIYHDIKRRRPKGWL